MNLPFDTEQLNLRGVIELNKFTEVDINKAIADYQESNTTVLSAAGKYSAAEKMMEETEKFLREGSDLYDDNRVSLEAALRDYEAAKRNAEVDIRNAYSDLLNLRGKVELAVKYEELQMRKLDNARIKYDKGYVSKDVFMSSQEQYLEAVFSKYKAICDFNIKNSEFLNMIYNE
jgi:hypothetical protein